MVGSLDINTGCAAASLKPMEQRTTGNYHNWPTEILVFTPCAWAESAHFRWVNPPRKSPCHVLRRWSGRCWASMVLKSAGAATGPDTQRKRFSAHRMSTDNSATPPCQEALFSKSIYGGYFFLHFFGGHVFFVWLLASGFWLLASGFWLLASGSFGFWLLACICCILEPKSLICVLFAAVWSQFACPFGFWLLAPSVSGFWLVFAAFWSQNLWFACYLLQFGANLHAHLAFGFWLLAPSVSGFWLVFAAFWNQNLWFACYLLQFGANLHAHLAFGFWLWLHLTLGFWFLVFVVFLALVSLGFWLLAALLLNVCVVL